MVSPIQSAFLDSQVWKLITSVLIPVSLSLTTSIGYTTYTRRVDIREKAVREFVLQSNQLEGAVYQFVSPVLQHTGTAGPNSNRPLLENITNQTHALDEARNYLALSHKGLATSYSASLLRLRQLAVERSVTNLDEFYVQANRVVTQRVQLVEALGRD